MKTYPIFSNNKDFIGFEISNTFTRLSRIIKLLQYNLDIQKIEKQKFFSSSDIRIEFVYKNKKYIVCEPFGDNSRYWIGFNENNEYDDLDLKEIEKVFKKYKQFYFF